MQGPVLNVDQRVLCPGKSKLSLLSINAAKGQVDPIIIGRFPLVKGAADSFVKLTQDTAGTGFTPLEHNFIQQFAANHAQKSPRHTMAGAVGCCQ